MPQGYREIYYSEKYTDATYEYRFVQTAGVVVLERAM